jgi:hypothetical protein
MPDEKTHIREFSKLLIIQDNYPKWVVSMDEFAGVDYKGIRHIHVREFLFMQLGIGFVIPIVIGRFFTLNPSGISKFALSNQFQDDK